MIMYFGKEGGEGEIRRLKKLNMRGVYLTTEVNEGQRKGGHEAECTYLVVEAASCSVPTCDCNRAQAAARACFSMCSPGR